jgi:hypothetical protein
MLRPPGASSPQRLRAVTGFLVLAAGAALLIRADVARTMPGNPGRPGPGRPDRGTGATAAPAAARYHRHAARSPATDPPRRAEGLDARLAAALAPVVRHQASSLSVGVFDPAAGVTATYHAHRSFDTASIVKADILAVLLLQDQQADEPLSQEDQDLAAEMIEDSDNDAASALWDAVHGGPGLAAGNKALGLRGIAPGPGGYWGLTTTTVSGQLRLLSDLTSARSPLPASARHYELSLMRNVEGGQDWGVTAAAGASTRPAVKNGWLPADPDGAWVINSIGVIRATGQRLLVAVLSSGQPSESAGIGQVQAAARAAASAVTRATR